MTLGELKSLMSRFGIRPQKSLGQNFLLSEQVLDRIVAAADLAVGEEVLEVGPGLGALTRRLAEANARVVAMEKDRKLVAALRKMFKNQKNVKIVYGDALRDLDLPTVADGNDSHKGFKLVANIPYYITGKFLRNVLGGQSRPSLIVLLLQKEVAERLTAKPGDMSLLSVSVQFYADPEVIAAVPRENFYPTPEVDSAIVRLRVLPKPRLAVEETQFFRLVKIGFANKRKQLHNNLAAGLPKTAGLDYKSVLIALGLNPLCRAQDLSLRDWEGLYLALFDSGSKSVI